MKPRTARIAASVVASALLFAMPAHAYLKLYESFGTKRLDVRWTAFPIRYYISDRMTPSAISLQQFQSTIADSFGVWQAVASASVSAQFAGLTSALPGDEDRQTTLGFLNRPDLADVLGATGVVLDEETGEILDADIFFNGSIPWSTAANGEAGRFDLESVAVHEIGHLFGLNHSGLGNIATRAGGFKVIDAESVMFPVAFEAGTIDGRRLKADDIAGISQLYPNRSSTAPGGITGRVTEGGRGVLGAHVVAFSLADGSLIAGFSTTVQGDFDIGGLAPGFYVVRVEPIDDGSPESFFVPPDIVDVGFKTRYFPDLVVVPSGGRAAPIEVQVESK
jgi:Matrixin